MDRDPYRYQAFLSDIAGQDIQSHAGDPARTIAAIRTWFATEVLGRRFPGGAQITSRYETFRRELGPILREQRLTREVGRRSRGALLLHWCEPLGLKLRRDGIGNLFLRRAGTYRIEQMGSGVVRVLAVLGPR